MRRPAATAGLSAPHEPEGEPPARPRQLDLRGRAREVAAIVDLTLRVRMPHAEREVYDRGLAVPVSEEVGGLVEGERRRVGKGLGGLGRPCRVRRAARSPRAAGGRCGTVSPVTCARGCSRSRRGGLSKSARTAGIPFALKGGGWQFPWGRLRSPETRRLLTVLEQSSRLGNLFPIPVFRL